MKERIVIKDEFWVKHFQEREKDFYEEDLCSGGNPEEWWHYEKEQVPETFEELKELCKDLKDVDIEEADEMDVAHIIIHNADLIYFEDEILMIAGFKKLEIKPAQMWAIIKNLIGDM